MLALRVALLRTYPRESEVVLDSAFRIPHSEFLINPFPQVHFLLLEQLDPLFHSPLSPHPSPDEREEGLQMRGATKKIPQARTIVYVTAGF